MLYLPHTSPPLNNDEIRFRTVMNNFLAKCEIEISKLEEENKLLRLKLKKALKNNHRLNSKLKEAQKEY